MTVRLSRAILEDLYWRYNDRRFADPDPILFLYRYDDPLDREVVGLIAASLAYGKVDQILKSVQLVLDRIGGSPAESLGRLPWRDLRRRFGGFKHRWTTGDEVASFLSGIHRAQAQFGSLEACFLEGLDTPASTLTPALSRFVDQIYRHAEGCPPASLLPVPERGSASKRLHLFLRWMVRRDAVDPGGWDRVPASKLMVPLDTHMHRIGQILGMTTRRQAGLAAALDVTNVLRGFCPEDPVKYDFSLTRLGIRPDADLPGFFHRCGVTEANQ